MAKDSKDTSDGDRLTTLELQNEDLQRQVKELIAKLSQPQTLSPQNINFVDAGQEQRRQQIRRSADESRQEAERQAEYLRTIARGKIQLFTWIKTQGKTGRVMGVDSPEMKPIAIAKYVKDVTGRDNPSISAPSEIVCEPYDPAKHDDLLLPAQRAALQAA